MIFLSAGHSTVDPGATTTVRNVAGKTVIRSEADVVEEFRNIVSFCLRDLHIEHKADGVGEQNMPLADTIKMVGNNRPALEFHCNSVFSPLATGVETLSSAKDLVLAHNLCVAISSALGIRDRGAKPEDAGQHHRLGFVRAGGIIVELFFLSNPNDLAAYDAKKWRAARAVANVLAGGAHP